MKYLIKDGAEMFFIVTQTSDRYDLRECFNTLKNEGMECTPAIESLLPPDCEIQELEIDEVINW